MVLDEHYLERITGLDSDRRNTLAGYYGSLDELARVEAHRRQREIFREWLADNKMPPNRGGEANYAAFLSALLAMVSEEQRANPDFLSEKASVSSTMKQRKPRKQRLRNSLEKRFMSELIRLREEENLSWRQLSEYFKKEFRKTVSHTYLKRIYDEHLATV
jgi:hypothetical protein